MAAPPANLPYKPHARLQHSNRTRKDPAKEKRKAPCKFYAKGFCTKGVKCFYEHPTEHRVTKSIDTAAAVNARELLVKPLPSTSLTTPMNGTIITFEPGAVVGKLLLPTECIAYEVKLSGKRSKKLAKQTAVESLKEYWDYHDGSITALQPDVGKQVILVGIDKYKGKAEFDTTSRKFRQQFPGLALTQIDTTGFRPSDTISSPAAAVYIMQRRKARQESVMFRGVCKGLVLADPLPDGTQQYVTVDKASARSRALRLQHLVTHNPKFGHNVRTRLARARLAEVKDSGLRMPGGQIGDQNVWKLDIFGLNFGLSFADPSELHESERNFEVLTPPIHPFCYWRNYSFTREIHGTDYKVAKIYGGIRHGTFGARVDLRNAEDADSTVRKINGDGAQPKKSLPYSSAMRIHVARITAPRWLICASRKDIKDLVSTATDQSKKTIVHIDVEKSDIEAKDSAASKFSQLTIWGEDADCIGVLKVAIAEMLRGQIITFKGRPVWHHYFASAPGLKYLAKLGHHKGVIIYRQNHLETSSHEDQLRLAGSHAHLGAIAQLLDAKIGKLSGTVYRLSLTDAMIAHGRSGAFQRIAQSLPRRSVVLRLFSDTQFLEITGCRADLDRARDLLTVTSADPQRDQSSVCPICFCDVEDEVSGKCGHSYCRSCFADQCHQWDVASSHVVCHGVEGLCSHAFGMDELETMLSAEDFRGLLHSAFEGYIAKNADALRFCPTTDCNHVYRTTSIAHVTRCDGCLVGICTKCKTPEHAGITCVENEDIHDSGKRLLQEWMKTRNAKQCPTEGCSTIVEKNGGCDHMICTTCRAHFCFKCLAMFTTSQETYDHMVAAHGHIGIEAPPEVAGLDWAMGWGMGRGRDEDVNPDLLEGEAEVIEQEMIRIHVRLFAAAWRNGPPWQGGLEPPDEDGRVPPPPEPERHEMDARLAERLQDVELRLAGVMN